MLFRGVLGLQNADVVGADLELFEGHGYKSWIVAVDGSESVAGVERCRCSFVYTGV